mmetsp:Transcript_14621/g.31197  ORF Transcript_14621/g.31197 Transcript_14621/m.31197 type:complete len:203 (-) Transcript_14621:677-1285(-)
MKSWRDSRRLTRSAVDFSLFVRNIHSIPRNVSIAVHHVIIVSSTGTSVTGFFRHPITHLFRRVANVLPYMLSKRHRISLLFLYMLRFLNHRILHPSCDITNIPHLLSKRHRIGVLFLVLPLFRGQHFQQSLSPLGGCLDAGALAPFRNIDESGQFGLDFFQLGKLGVELRILVQDVIVIGEFGMELSILVLDRFVIGKLGPE